MAKDSNDVRGMVTVEAVELRQLAKEMSTRDIARETGRSLTGINKALRDGRCHKVLEEWARLYRAYDPEKMATAEKIERTDLVPASAVQVVQPRVIFAGTCDPAHFAALEGLARGLGFTVKAIDRDD